MSTAALDRLLDLLAEVHPPALGGVSVGHLMEKLLPYRSVRRKLGVSSIEEYELLVLRLCSGEGGYARVDPGELVASCREALENPAPSLEMVAGLAEARIQLIRGPEDSDLPIPVRLPSDQPPPPPGLPGQDRSDEDPTEAPERVAGRCPSCALPITRMEGIRFCPACGTSVGTVRCSKCSEEVTPGWRHCPHCGHRIEERDRLV